MQKRFNIEISGKNIPKIVQKYLKNPKTDEFGIQGDIKFETINNIYIKGDAFYYTALEHLYVLDIRVKGSNFSLYSVKKYLSKLSKILDVKITLQYSFDDDLCSFNAKTKEQFYNHSIFKYYPLYKQKYQDIFEKHYRKMFKYELFGSKDIYTMGAGVYVFAVQNARIVEEETCYDYEFLDEVYDNYCAEIKRLEENGKKRWNKN